MLVLCSPESVRIVIVGIDWMFYRSADCKNNGHRVLLQQLMLHQKLLITILDLGAIINYTKT